MLLIIAFFLVSQLKFVAVIKLTTKKRGQEMKKISDDKTGTVGTKKLNITAMKQTNHFTERYIERVWGGQIKVKKEVQALKNLIYREIEKNFLDREKQILIMFGPCQKVVIPYMRKFQIVVCQNRLITIY